MTQQHSLARELSNWAMTLRFDQAPADTRQAIANCLLYNLTMGLAVDDSNDQLGMVLRSIAHADGPARLFRGRGTRSAADAAFINAGLITARGQNDTHPQVVTHIGCIVIPAVLAVADIVKAPPRRILDAVLVGYESIPRIAQALSAETTRRGFRASSLYGSLGAALACSSLLGLTARQAQASVSIATNMASGLLQTWIDGSEEWRLQIAKTSRDGVHAALLAMEGLSGAEFCLEGASGFARAYAGVPPALDLSGWRTPEMVFKPYPGCAFNQAPVQALRDLVMGVTIKVQDVQRLDIFMNPTDAGYPGVALHGPFETSAGAIMSAPFMLAATLVHGRPRISDFQEQARREELHQLSRKICVRPTPSIAPWTCELELETSAGYVHRQRFAPATPFRLDWGETWRLTSEVAQEWNLPAANEKFGRLVACTENVPSAHLDLESLIHVLYTDH
ncbi:hypothetical protein CEG14_20365 [Bordetella genomosp. 1]|uniref:2-methylcitrate dehydratase n=1 Tax=Bordetella genomosp. 1 TaxID=1395607 RepID=A0A261S868_9BORD|nr:MmgE/PrpD family protein [Bordetella genomosp. 1]OZI33197.1 hypothetical protein CEG14_20365 [Bordetella genomosp. 1]